MKAKEKCEWIKQNISIVDYASSIGFTVVRKGKFYSLKEHDKIKAMAITGNNALQNSDANPSAKA